MAANPIQAVLDSVVSVIDSVPVLKKYRTVILLLAIASLVALDKTHVGPGNLYSTYSPYLWPLAVATGLAHQTTQVQTALEKK